MPAGRRDRTIGQPRRQDRLLRALAPLLALAATFPAAPALAQEQQAAKPDFSQVLTIEDAERLVAEGELVPIHLFPTELGGPDVAENIAYVTPLAAATQLRIIVSLKRMMRDNSIDKMEVRPSYKGDSIVPSRITVKARHSTKDSGFQPIIGVW